MQHDLESRDAHMSSASFDSAVGVGEDGSKRGDFFSRSYRFWFSSSLASSVEPSFYHFSKCTVDVAGNGTPTSADGPKKALYKRVRSDRNMLEMNVYLNSNLVSNGSKFSDDLFLLREN